MKEHFKLKINWIKHCIEEKYWLTLLLEVGLPIGLIYFILVSIWNMT